VRTTSDEIYITAAQFNKWLELETIRNNALWRVAESISLLKDHLQEALEIATADNGKWQSIQNETISAGFASVVEAIAKLQTPLPPPQHQMKGTVMADYSIPDDQPDGRVTFHLSATDAEGQPITDPAVLATLTFEVASSDENAFAVTLDAEQPDPLNRVGGYHVGAPGQAAVTGNLKDADGNIIGTGTDGFTVTTGKVAPGSVSATFDGLTPIGG
jgi:hypothetical protein